MRLTRVGGAAVLVLVGTAALYAAGLESGIPVGGRIPKYQATKCGGGDDGVELGASLCYT